MKKSVGPTTSIYQQRTEEHPGVYSPENNPQKKPGVAQPSELPFDKLMKVAHKVGSSVYGWMNKLNSTGNNMSPTTKHDR